MAARRPLALVGGSPAELPNGDTLAGHEVRLVFVLDGGSAAVAAGAAVALPGLPAGTILEWTLVADQSGSAVVDLRKATLSGYPTVASIAASAKPTLSSAAKASSTTLTGWTTAVAAGDVIRAVVESASTVTQLTLVLRMRLT